MQAKIIIMAAAIIAATAAMAMYPTLATHNAMAKTVTFCVHNGNGKIQDSCSGGSGTTETCTVTGKKADRSCTP